MKPKASNEPVKEYNNNVNQQWITMKNDKQALKEQGKKQFSYGAKKKSYSWQNSQVTACYLIILLKSVIS